MMMMMMMMTMIIRARAGRGPLSGLPQRQRGAAGEVHFQITQQR